MAEEAAKIQSSTGRLPQQSPLVPSKTEDVPGVKPAALATRMVEGTAAALQSFKPLSNFSQHICTWALYSQDPSRKIQTHHYASRLSEDVVQCIVFDSPEPNARIIGIEYIVSENVFQLLPEEEKKMWHSHAYEISEGLWVNPLVPESLQQAEQKRLLHTYGKFWNTWQFDRGDKLPLGPPALMVSPQDHPSGRIPEPLIKARDEQLSINTNEKREARTFMRQQVQGKHSDKCSDWWALSGEGWMTLIKPVPLNLEAQGEGPIRSLGSGAEQPKGA